MIIHLPLTNINVSVSPRTGLEGYGIVCSGFNLVLVLTISNEQAYFTFKSIFTKALS